MRRQWTRQETATLIQFTEAGINAKLIAKLIGRSYSSTACKRNRLGFRLYPQRIPEPGRPIVFVADIQRIVAEHFNVSAEDMASRNRAPEVARPRQVAMFLARDVCRKSYPNLGQIFRRDHTTIIHAVRQVERRMAEQDSFKDDVTTLREKLVSEKSGNIPQLIGSSPPFLSFAHESVGA